MPSTKKILNVVYECAQELNNQLPEAGRIECDSDTVLVGDECVLDSLGLVTLFVSIEGQVGDLGTECSLLDELMNEQGDVHPFATMGSTAKWIEKKIRNVEGAD